MKRLLLIASFVALLVHADLATRAPLPGYARVKLLIQNNESRPTGVRLRVTNSAGDYFAPLGHLPQPDPTSRSGHRRMLVVEYQLHDRGVRVARTLKRSQKRFWIIRERLAYGLLVISVLGTIAAWIVATRVLSPIREMVREMMLFHILRASMTLPSL